MTIKIDKFTLNYEPEEEGFYKVWFTDLDYRRGAYRYALGKSKIAPVIFKSSNFPQLDGNIFYLPGANSLKDNTVVKVSAAMLQKVIDILDGKEEDEDIDQYLVNFSRDYHHYYIILFKKPDPEAFYSLFSCKETLIASIGGIYSKYQPVVYVCEKFTDEQIEWLNSIQEKIEPENRSRITKIGEQCLKVEFPPWWLTQANYRLGWLFLAVRIANKRYAILPDNLTKFQEFQNGKFNIPDGAYMHWSSTANWIHGFNNNSHFGVAA